MKGLIIAFIVMSILLISVSLGYMIILSTEDVVPLEHIVQSFGLFMGGFALLMTGICMWEIECSNDRRLGITK